MRHRLAAALLVLAAAACTGDAGSVRAPNIVLIIGDDHGYRDFGFMGSEIAHTPHLDRLAAGGTVFPFGYSTASVCRPALRTLLTGLHPIQFDRRQQRAARNGIPVSPRTPLRNLFHTLPELLAERGYASFQSGKFQEGAYQNAGFTDGMTRTTGKAGRKQGIRIARETMKPVFSFIDAHLDQPFFVWFAPQLPHLPHNAPKQFYAPYEGIDLPWFAPGYFAAVTWFDSAVGQLVRHLEARGVRDRTLIVYFADNGWQIPGPGIEYDIALGGHQGKASLYELGFRTPILLNLPGVVPAGETIDDLVSTVDLFPTILGFAGAPVPENRTGVDLRALLDGSAPPPRDALIGTAAALRSDREREPPGGAFLRNRRWHYLWHRDGREALFDLLADPDETHDVADRHPGLTRSSRERIRKWSAAMTDSVDRHPDATGVF